MNKKSKKIKNELANVTKEDMQLIEPKRKKIKKHLYLGYSSRLFILIILFISSTLLSTLFFYKSITIQKEKNIFYEEYGSPDYKVYLKDNIYYEENYLEKDMSYIANIIDYISIDYNYRFNCDTPLNGEYYYKIVADLEIINLENKSLFYSKKYDLSDEKKFTLKNQKEYTINENIKINYDYYNSLANNFKSSYGINTESNLKVYLEIHRRIEKESINNPEINGDSKINLIIPLSKKAINIEIDSLKIKNNNVILSKNDYKVDDIKYLILGILFIIISIIIFVRITKRIWILQCKNNNYDKILKKILRQYDRLIVNTNTMPNLKNSNITEVDNFFELLDAKDNIHKPIFYHEVTPHQKCHFFIKDDNDLIIYTLKNNNSKK